MNIKKSFYTKFMSIALISILTFLYVFTGQAYAKILESPVEIEIMTVEIPSSLNDFAIKNFDKQIQSIYNEAEHYGFDKQEVNSLYLGEPFSCYNYENNDVTTGDILA